MGNPTRRTFSGMCFAVFISISLSLKKMYRRRRSIFYLLQLPYLSYILLFVCTIAKVPWLMKYVHEVFSVRITNVDVKIEMIQLNFCWKLNISFEQVRWMTRRSLNFEQSFKYDAESNLSLCNRKPWLRKLVCIFI